MDGDVPYLKEATMTDEPLTIATYPWRTIDAADMLRRMHAAEELNAKLQASSGELAKASTEFADEVLAAVDVVGGVLDYNDQCDLVFGRISRLIMEKPEARIVDVGELGELGLDVTGLGVSGAQVEMALDKARLIADLGDMHKEFAGQPLSVWVDLNVILADAGIEPRATVEACEGGDLVDRVKRLVLARKVALGQSEAATAALDGERDALKAAKAE